MFASLKRLAYSSSLTFQLRNSTELAVVSCLLGGCQATGREDVFLHRWRFFICHSWPIKLKPTHGQTPEKSCFEKKRFSRVKKQYDLFNSISVTSKITCKPGKNHFKRTDEFKKVIFKILFQFWVVLKECNYAIWHLTLIGKLVTSTWKKFSYKTQC